MGGLVYFFADDSTDRDLWVSDGTGPGTTKVYEMQSIAAGDVIRELVATSGQLWFFLERTGGVTPPFELWRSDGTTLGTELLMTFEDYFRGGSVARNGRLFFAADDGANGLELWVSDGTTVGTETVYEHAEPGSSIRDIMADGADVYFLADDGIVGKELWKSDGTAGGTTLVFDADPAGDGFTSLDGTAFSGGFYFTYDDPFVGRELFRHDGMGITLVDDLIPGIVGSYPYGFFASPTHLFWGADYPTDSTELMMTDGVIIERGDTGPGDDSPEEFVFYDGLTYFSALADTEGRELHRSDGTAAGTELFVDLDPVGSGSPEDLTPGLGLLFFQATNGDGGEPWVSDGTVAGTQQLADINPGPDYSNPEDFVEANGLVFFTANDGLLGGALFVTDGTPAGTKLVFDLDPTSINSASADLVPVPGGVVFAAVDATAGREVFFSDGTSTTMLKDILPGPPGSAPGWFTALDGRAFFVANDGVNGPELWTSDGTPGGTRLVLDVQPGAGGSGPSWLTPAEGALFFAANDGVTGFELHRYLLPLFGDGFESGDTGAWSGAFP
jgi:ELWxxDGT repeat protein